MADNGFLMSEEYIRVIEDLRSKVDTFINEGTAEGIQHRASKGRYVRLTELADLLPAGLAAAGLPEPFPFGELVPYKATAVMWNNKISPPADYGWVDIDPIFDPSAGPGPGIVQEYVYAANGTIGLEDTVQFIERKVRVENGVIAQPGDIPAGVGTPFWFFSVNGESQLAKITSQVMTEGEEPEATGTYLAEEVDFELIVTGKKYGEDFEFPVLRELNLAKDVKAATIVVVLKKKGKFYFQKSPGEGVPATCTIVSEASPNQYNVTVQVGNPNASAVEPLPVGILFLNYATTNALALGGVLFAIVYPSISGPAGTFDCFAIETLMNLVAPPEPEPEPEGP